MKNNPFNSLKIIELASVLAGPSVGMFFAELGADVLKIENKNTEGDVTRSWKTVNESESHLSAYFTSVNWGKQFLRLSLNVKKDYAELIDLVKEADIVISSYKPGDDLKLKVDYESLKKINQKIIYAQISAYGLDSKRTGYDAILQAETGFMAMNGDAESLPMKMPVAFVDILAAHQLKEGILVALINRMSNNIGEYIHVSLKDAAIASLANQASNYLMTGVNPQRLGSEHPNIVPYGTLFETKDHKLFIMAIGTDKQFTVLCDSINLNELANDISFESNQMRVKNKVELITILRDRIKEYESNVLIQLLQNKSIPCAVVKSFTEVFSQDDTKHLILSNKSGTKRAVRTTIFNSTNFDRQHHLSEPE